MPGPWQRAASPTLPASRGLADAPALPRWAGRLGRRRAPAGPDQRPGGVHRLQFDQLPLARSPRPASSASAPRRRVAAPLCAQPVAQRVRQRLRAAFHLEVAAQDAAAVGRQAAIDRRAQGADRGDDADAQGEAQQHDPQPAHAAAQFPPRQPEGQHQATGSAGAGDRSTSATRPSARWTCRSQRAARCGVVGDQHQRGAGAARRREQQVHHRSPVAWSRLPVGSSASSSRGSRREGAGQRHALLLAAGKLAGQMGQPMAQPDGVQRLRRARHGVARAGEFQRHRDVLQRGHGRDQVERLEHDADRARGAAAPARPRPSR